MAFPLKILEDFFSARFDFDGQPLGVLTHFDGFAHWTVWYLPENQLLKVMAGSEIGGSAYPTVEIEGFYTDDCSVSPLVGGGTVLILRPKGMDKASHYVAITKTNGGRLSLSTTVGEINAKI